MSKPVVYEHFGGKEGLYAVVVDREMSDLLNRLTRALSSGEPPRTRREGRARVATYIEDKTDGFRILVRDSPMAGTAGGTFSSLLNDIASQVEHILGREFARRGLNTEHAPMYAQMLVGMVALTGTWCSRSANRRVRRSRPTWSTWAGTGSRISNLSLGRCETRSRADRTP